MSANQPDGQDLKMLETVRKLIAKAESCAELGNEAEASVYMGKANELMERYMIDQLMLDQTRPLEQRQTPIEVEIKFANDRKFAEVQKRLLSVCVQYNRCRCWFTAWHSGHVIGYPSDANYVDLLFTSIYAQMESHFSTNMTTIKFTPKTEKAKAKPGIAGFKPMNKLAVAELDFGQDYRIEFMRGYVRRLYERFDEMQGEHETSTELVLANAKEAVDSKYAELTAGFRWTRSYELRTETNAQARAAGASAANKANLRPGHGLRRQREIGQ